MEIFHAGSIRNHGKLSTTITPLENSADFVLRYFQKPRGRNREVNVLPESARDEFKSIEILCTEYKGLSERQEIELFQRVQLGKPLSRAEALRATEGGWQEFAKLYETKFANVTNCKHSPTAAINND